MEQATAGRGVTKADQATRRKISSFCFVGIINTTVDYLVLNVIVYLGVVATVTVAGQSFFVANLIAVSGAMLGSFIMNKQWTFPNNSKELHTQVFYFVLVTAFSGLLLQQFVFSFVYMLPLGVGIEPFVWLNVAKTISIGVALVWNFLMYNFIVFS